MYRTKKRQSKKLPEIPKAVIYARVSTKEQEEGFSIDAQLGLLRGYAAGKGLEVVAEFVEAETAKSSGRTEFGKMVQLIKRGKASVIIVEKTDRMYRNLRDRVTIDELAAELHLVKEGVIISKDSRSHETFVHNLKVIIARNYCDNLSEEARKGMAEKAKQGFYPSFAPLGYLNAHVDGAKVIVPDPERAKIIRQMFEAYADGDISLKKMASYAKMLGLTTRKKGTPVHHSTVQYMLQNPVYAGWVEWHGQRYPGRHEPIVSLELFERAQTIMDSRTPATGGKISRSHTYAGMIRCGVCGCAISPYVSKGYTYYACSGAKGCRRAGVREEVLDAAIAQQLEGLTIRPAVMAMLKTAIREMHTEQNAGDGVRLELLRKERDRLLVRMEQLYLDRLDGKVMDGMYQKLSVEWNIKADQLASEIANIEKATSATWEDNVRMLEMVSNSANRFKSAKSELKREMAKNLLSNFSLTAGNVAFELEPWFKMVFEANAATGENVAPEDLNVIWWAQLDSN